MTVDTNKTNHSELVKVSQLFIIHFVPCRCRGASQRQLEKRLTFCRNSGEFCWFVYDVANSILTDGAQLVRVLMAPDRKYTHNYINRQHQLNWGNEEFFDWLLSNESNNWENKTSKSKSWARSYWRDEDTDGACRT